jgi:hypothetical protein
VKAAMPEREAARHLAWALGLPYVEPEAGSISPGTLRKLALRVSLASRCVPLVYNARRVVLVIDQPATALILGADPGPLGLSPGQRLEFALTPPSALEAWLARRAEMRP